MTWTPLKQTILVPFVFSEASIEALHVARASLAKDGALHVVHVLPPPTTMTPGWMFDNYSANDLEKRAQTNIQEELTRVGYGESKLHIVMGDPASSIRSCARSIGAELIVLPSHGRSGFERWFLGSVAEHILRDAPCPVLVLDIKDKSNQSEEEDNRAG